MAGHLQHRVRRKCGGVVRMKLVKANPPGIQPFPFFVHEKDDAFISHRIARSGVWEPFESAMMLGLLSPGDQFIDVGANIGWYSIAAATRIGTGGHVLAIEPDAGNFALLEANIKQTGASVTPFRCALGSATGRGTLSTSSTNKGDHRVRNFVVDEPRGSPGTVRVETLDNVLESSGEFDIDRLRVIKIDVQGFEAEVLKGSTRLLSRLPARTLMFLEFEPSLLRDASPSACEELIDMIASIGRNIFQICRPLRKLRKLSVLDLAQFVEQGDTSADLVIVHCSQISALRSALPLLPRILSLREWRQ
jgi:FkbM family methyltransferase